MSNGPLSDIKKLLNNGGLRARIAALSCLCDAAEATSSSLNKSELIRLERSDQPAIKALDACIASYEEVFRDAGSRLLSGMKD